MRLGQQQSFVSVYEVDEKKLLSLRILNFDKPDKEWLRFVVANRKGIAPTDGWDLISGTVANDQTMPVIDLFSMVCMTRMKPSNAYCRRS